MRISRWAAVAVTLLMGLANLGLISQSNLGLQILGPVLAVVALAAVIGFATQKPWGPGAVLAVGAVNLAAAIAGAVGGLAGWPVGLVLSGLAIVLVVVAGADTRRRKVVTP